MKKIPGSSLIDPVGYDGGSAIDPWGGPLSGFIDCDGAK